MLGTVAFILASLQDRPLNPTTLAEFRKEVHDDAGAETLATKVRQWFGRSITTGSETRSDGTLVAWAIESDARPEVRVAGERPFRLDRIGKTNVWTGTRRLKDGIGEFYTISASGKELGKGFVEVYEPEPETKVIPGVPQGTVRQMPKHTSAIFNGASRDWWIYVPAGLSSGEEAALMVFQDGQGPKNWAPTVFDNLIAKGEMPKTVAVFVPPGTFSDGRSNRSFEYDTLSDQYVRFLLEEILPEVEKVQKLSKDPTKRAITGISSGGICAFTAAWERPDQFGKVLSCIGSFTNIASGPTLRAGGHNYPAIIRKTDRKPIRVYLQDGRNDLDNIHGSWPLA
ncbi:enterochelin esterase, partial [bacterium]